MEFKLSRSFFRLVYALATAAKSVLAGIDPKEEQRNSSPYNFTPLCMCVRHDASVLVGARLYAYAYSVSLRL